MTGDELRVYARGVAVMVAWLDALPDYQPAYCGQEHVRWYNHPLHMVIEVRWWSSEVVEVRMSRQGSADVASRFHYDDVAGVAACVASFLGRLEA